MDRLEEMKRRYTYKGRRVNTVIDYVLGYERGREEIVRLEIGDKVNSDYFSVIAWVR